MITMNRSWLVQQRIWLTTVCPYCSSTVSSGINKSASCSLYSLTLWAQASWLRLWILLLVIISVILVEETNDKEWAYKSLLFIQMSKSSKENYHEKEGDLSTILIIDKIYDLWSSYSKKSLMGLVTQFQVWSFFTRHLFRHLLHLPSISSSQEQVHRHSSVARSKDPSSGAQTGAKEGTQRAYRHLDTWACTALHILLHLFQEVGDL